MAAVTGLVRAEIWTQERPRERSRSCANPEIYGVQTRVQDFGVLNQDVSKVRMGLKVSKGQGSIRLERKSVDSIIITSPSPGWQLLALG